MALVASNIIVMWPSTNASIPAGWTRETSLDGFYVQGAAAGADADLTTVRGAATHVHTSPAHTPTQNSHTHTITGNASNNTVRNVSLAAADAQPSPQAHTHDLVASNSTTATNNSVTITVDAASNDLTFVTVIFIKSDGTPTGVPVNAYAFFQSDTLPTSWTRVQGDKYLKGAAAAGDGGATGGSATHTHTSPAHTHTQNSHTHAATTSGADNSVTFCEALVSGVAVASDHTHTHAVTLSAATPTNQSVTTTIGSSNLEPVYKYLNLINNGNAGADFPTSIIALWGGTNAGVPPGWSRYTTMDAFFPKHASANGQSGATTGGTTTHTHTGTNCQPTQNTHTHTTSVAAATPNLNCEAGFDLVVERQTHTHTWSISSTVATNNSVAVTVDANTAESAYPQYKRVIFIQFSGTVPASSTPSTLALLGVG